MGVRAGPVGLMPRRGPVGLAPALAAGREDRLERDRAPPAGDRAGPGPALVDGWFLAAAEQDPDQRHRLVARLRRALVGAAVMAGERRGDCVLDLDHECRRAV